MDADALRKAKLAKLIEIEGFDSIEELMEAVFSDAVSPAICVNEDCDFTSYMKGYTVFNADQCDGLPAHYYAKAEPPAVTPMQRLEAADRFFAYRLRGATIEIVRVYHSSRRWPERL